MLGWKHDKRVWAISQVKYDSTCCKQPKDSLKLFWDQQEDWSGFSKVSVCDLIFTLFART